MRAVAEIEPMKRSNRMQIVVTELPYQVNKAGLIEKIAAHVKNKRLDGITEIRDESDPTRDAHRDGASQRRAGDGDPQ